MPIEWNELLQRADFVEGSTFTAPIPEGGVPEGARLVVVFTLPDVAGTVSCTDARGNSYATDVEATSEGQARLVILSAPVATALEEADLITVSSPATANRSLAILTLTGLDAAGVVDQTDSATGSGGAPSAGSVTPSTAEAALLAAFAAVNESVSIGLFAGEGWTQGTGTGADPVYLGTEYRVVSSPGTYTGDGTFFPWSNGYAGGIVVYRAGGEAPGEEAVAGYPWPVRRRRARR